MVNNEYVDMLKGMYWEAKEHKDVFVVMQITSQLRKEGVDVEAMKDE